MAEKKENRSPDYIVYFIFANIAIILAYSFNSGNYFNPAQVFLIFCAFLSLLLPLINFKTFNAFRKSYSTKKLLLLSVFVYFLISALTQDSVVNTVSTEAITVILGFKLLSFILFLFYFIEKNIFSDRAFSAIFSHIKKYKFVYMIVLAFLMRIAIVLYSPDPRIDVFDVTNQQVDYLLAGQNPYAAEYSSPWLKWHSNPGYLPSIIFMNIPGRLFFGDVRIGYIAAQAITTLLLYLILKRKKISDKTIPELVVLLFIYIPMSLYVLRQAWVEQLLILLLFLFCFLYIKNKISYLAWSALGAIISFKQNNFPFLVFSLHIFKPNWKKISAAMAIPILTIIPFVLWDYKSFINATFINLINFKMTLHSISINTLIRRQYDHDIPFYISFGILILLIVFLISLKKKGDILYFVYFATTTLLASFMLIYGFSNYYYFINGSLVLLVALNLPETDSGSKKSA